MDIQRVREIIDAPYMIHVSLRGIPVYIKELLEEEGLVTVFPLDDMESEEIVSVNELSEDHTFVNAEGGLAMNTHRAKDISESPDMKNVTYNGRQVYIQHVDEENNIAQVYHLDDPGREFEVEVSTLEENE